MKILVIEDNKADQLMLKECVSSCDPSVELIFVPNGADALTLLTSNVSGNRPDIILLDLNLPKMDGREFLAELRKDSLLGNLPVIVMSTSASKEDMAMAHGCGAAKYILKTGDFFEYESAVKDLIHFCRHSLLAPR